MLVAYWFRSKNPEVVNNWGDAINPTLIEFFAGEIPTHINDLESYLGPVYYVVGSILDRAKNNSVVWGSGFITEKSTISANPKILAVRGPLTRKSLLNQGIDCPEIYGDPALLFPLIYKPVNSKKKYKIGVIPHYVDKENAFVKNLENNPDVLVIDITQDKFKFIDEINSCEIIFSSSLHGIIASDAYNIPAYWVEFSDKVIGNGFKFEDYFLSVNRPLIKPMVITENTELEDLHSQIYNYNHKIDLQPLLEVCPFNKLNK